MSRLAAIVLSAALAACNPPPEPAVEFPVVQIETAAAATMATDPPARPEQKEAALVGEGQLWSGRYLCPQGWTQVDLTIVAAADERVEAVFEFHHRGSGAQGSFRMSGRYDSLTGRLSLQPGDWVEQPAGYVSVGMTGTVRSSGTIYSGRMDDADCGAFELRRVDPPGISQ